jgi:hypothetical protein
LEHLCPSLSWQGKRLKRSGPISGVVLLDGNGNERAGFATSDGTAEVFIGLDSERAQEARFIVNREGGGHLTFFDDDKNYARIGIARGGLPTLVLRRKGETIFEQMQSEALEEGALRREGRDIESRPSSVKQRASFRGRAQVDVSTRALSRWRTPPHLAARRMRPRNTYRHWIRLQKFSP